MLGIFDSGSGGLTVLRAIRARAPRSDIVYFGDLKNAPYGNKSREEIGALTVLGIRRLIDAGATEIVSACNSVSVSIVHSMYDILKLPQDKLVEMVSPTISHFKGTEARVLVVATKATIESGAYQDGLRAVGVHADGIALPSLVGLIEGSGNEDDMAALIRTAVEPYANGGHTHIILGCTHFPLIAHVFDRVRRDLHMQAELYDPGGAVADEVARRFDVEGSGATRLLVSVKSAAFERFVTESCHEALDSITIV